MNNSDSEELFKRSKMTADHADEIKILRNAVESNKRTKGLAHQETLESMILLGDALGEASPNWLEEHNALSESDRKQRDEKLAKERKDLYESAFNKSIEIHQKITATLRYATILSSETDSDKYSAELFRLAIKLSSTHCGAYSEKTVGCIEDFLRSENYDASDLDTIYKYHTFLREKKGTSGFDSFSKISEFCETIGNLELALSFQEDALEHKMECEPLWFVYEGSSNYDDLCDIYCKMNKLVRAVNLLDSVIESYVNIEPREKSPDREDILKSLQDIKQQIVAVRNQDDPDSNENNLEDLIKKTYSKNLFWGL